MTKDQSMHTDIHAHLIRLSQTLLERIDGTEGKWKAHWQLEYAAVQRCIWALEK